MAYYLTVNIEKAGTKTTDGGESIAGHMWYSITNTDTGEKYDYGYTSNPHAPISERLHGPGHVTKDDDVEYEGDSAYSRKIEITKEQYDAMKYFGDNAYAGLNDDYLTYDWMYNSCVDFVYDALKAGGLNPSGYNGTWMPIANKDMIDWLLTSCEYHVGGSCRTNFDASQAWIQRYDPLTLDLDGDGIETVAASTTDHILFDQDGDGVKTGTGWIKSDDGFLVMDRNNNGTIDNGTELFGDSTPLNGGGTAEDGFAALAQEDTNADGVVSSLDNNWENLRVWRDLNSDGISQSGELLTMEQAGITGFNVGSTEHSQTLSDGNQIADLGTYTKTDGTTATMGEVSDMADVDLSVDTFNREFTDEIAVSEEVSALPDMEGAGLVRDLQEAAMQSSDLKDLLTQYSAATTRASQMALIDQLLDAWADTSGLAETMEERDPEHYRIQYNSFGSKTRSYVSSTGGATEYLPDVENQNLTEEYRDLISAWSQKLHILEAFNGRYFFTFPDETQDGASAVSGMTVASGTSSRDTTETLLINFSQTQLELLQQSYDALRESVYESLFYQSRFETYFLPLLDKIELTVSDDGSITWNYSQLEQYFIDEIAANPLQGMTDLIEFNKYLGNAFLTSDWEGNTLAAHYIRSLATTSELQELYSFYDITVVGEASSNYNGTTEDDFLLSRNSGGTVNGSDGDDILIGNDEVDVLSGGNGDDKIYGGAGNDTLYGGSDDDAIDGGTGADYLYGGVGNDTYVFWAGSGQDTVAGYDSTSGRVDTIKFNDVTSTGLRGVRLYEGYLVLDYGTSDSIFIESGYNSSDTSFGINYYAFSDGVTITKDELLEAYAVTYTSASEGVTLGEGNETVYAGGGNDSINGAGGDDVIYGESGSDSLSGYTGNDILYGGADDDTLRGDEGNDLLSGGDGNDYIVGGADDDTLLGGSGDDYLLGVTSNDVIDGGSGNDYLSGGDGNDTYILRTGSGQDTVSSYDTTSGHVETISFEDVTSTELRGIRRSGADLVLDYGTSDNLTMQSWYNDGSGVQVNQFVFSDNVTLTADELLSSYVVSYTDESESAALGGGNDTVYAGGGNDSINGAGGDDVIYGESGSDSLSGYTANDILYGGADDDTLRGDEGNDLLSGGDGNDYIVGGADDDTLLGGSGDDYLLGVTGNDIIDGGSGNDYLSGGTGNDTYIVDNAADTVFEDINAGTDTVESSITYTIGNNIENLTLTGTSAINGTGNTLNNVITGNTATNTLTGNAGNDTLDGSSGADIMIGGTGNDTYIVDNSGDVVTENASEGTDTVSSSITYTLVSNIENLILSGTSAVNGTGNELNNTITGNSAGNTLNGSTGADTMKGGLGDDAYIVDNAGGGVTENAGEGTDTVQSSITYTLGANVENLTLTGTTTLSGTGNDLNNVIVGNSANNILTGGAGNDTLDGQGGVDQMSGGTGNDKYMIDNTGDVVTENASEGTDTVESSITYTLGANVENLTLTGTTSLWGTGNDLNNVIIGNSADNSLTGGAGNDTLDGQGGVDQMSGGIGNDKYIIDNTGDVVTENASEGTDTVESSITYTLGANVENLTLTGTTSLWGTGNDLNNILIGNSAGNTLNGGTGADTMKGGLGDDTYIVDNTGDVVTENASEGTDTVESSITYTLGANVENLTMTGTTSLWGTGNDLNNVIIGNSADNSLTGGAGNDTLDGQGGVDQMSGGTGNDKYMIDNTGDVVTENASEGTDTVESSITYTLGANVENLTLTGTSAINGVGNELDNYLTGNSAINTLTGNAGNDTLDGGVGADTMVGGSGNDRYIVDNTGDTVTESSGAGTDSVQSSVSYTLSANVENLTLTGTSAINGTGNTLNNNLTGNSVANTLTGDAGNDTLTGGAGNDSLVGGTGSDTYKYSRTDGQDTINDYSTTTTDADILQMTDGITSTEPVIVKQNGDLYIFVDSGNYVKIASQFSSTNYGIERFEVSDGHYIARSDIEAIVNTMSSINNDTGMDVMQKYNAMMSDQTYIRTLAQTWHHV